MILCSADINAIAERVAEKVLEANDTVLTTEDVAVLLHKSPAAVRKMCARGQLPFSKHYGKYYFSKKAITEFLLSDD